MTFLRNTWYVAGHAQELSEEMVSRKICNEQIVLFRKADGQVAALEDRCPHRFVPLSMGKRVGDSLQCGYHGLRFDGTGACVEAPNDNDSQKARACIKAYRVVERDTLLWLWLGDAALADESRIPAFEFLSNTDKFTSCRGYSHIKANQQLIADNLLDLSHIHYLHPHIHQGSNFSDFTNKVRRDGDNIWSMLWRHHYHVDDQRKAMIGFASSDVEGQGHARWTVPGVLLVQTAFWDHGKSIDEPGAMDTPNAHLLTPETEYSTHYFWASGRNFMLDNEEMTAGTAAMMKMVFETQDGPMCEAQQVNMGLSTDFLDHRPLILQADAAGVMARRLMKQRIQEETAYDSAGAAAAE
ncbi:MAG TPA: aromatic ring-hydroxylating dioxygenase subunit alpha [Sphingobium sp.]|uniref:aromatic ring-hydroxylating dioxygenase subunit alpha n=1 Tax=Sphingobium sp. TaxID=1912891 RepID=UPI002ED1BDAE